MTALLVLLGVVIGAALTYLSRFLIRRHPVDALTGVPTRGAAHDALRAVRAGDAVVMLDVDGLKHTNDTVGHLAGDDALRTLAAHLRAGVRAHDTVARWGGDEFVIVLRGGADAAADVVARLRSSSPVSFSAGIAGVSGRDGDGALAAADAALLRAKRAGGGQMVVTS